MINFSDCNLSTQCFEPLSKRNKEILKIHQDAHLFYAYFHYLTFQKRYSPETIRAYGHALAELALISTSNSVNSIKQETIRLAIAQARSHGLKKSAIAQRLSTWRSYIRWAERNNSTPNNPLEGIRAPKLPKKLPHTLSIEQMQQVLDHPHLVKQNKKFTRMISCRNKAILELLYSSGLRLSELIGLNVNYIEKYQTRIFGWIDMNETAITIFGKGNKKRILPIGKKALDALELWLPIRKTMLNIRNATEPALFISLRCQRISPSSVRNIVKLAGLEASLPLHLHPHMMRHSFASHLLQSSDNIRAVQKLLGHESIASTQIYTSLDFQYLSKTYDATHPRALRKINNVK